MRPKEIQEKLGIDAERIKLFKREGIFKPEHPPVGKRQRIIRKQISKTCRGLLSLQNLA